MESYLAGATLKRLSGLEAVAATYKPNNNLTFLRVLTCLLVLIGPVWTSSRTSLDVTTAILVSLWAG